MNEFEELRRRFEHRTEEQLAAARKRLHDKFERVRRRKDRGGVGFDPPVAGGSEGALRPKGATPVLPRRKP